MNTDGNDYAGLIGNWVAARCRKRGSDYGRSVPQEVVRWLETGNNGAAVDADTKTTPEVLGWLVKTIEDPDWAE